METIRDVMQVCLGGHVITDVFTSHPEQGSSHCHRCGAPTLSRCPTCGADFPGAAPLPGLSTIGLRQAPQRCPGCGAAFPWTGKPDPVAAAETTALLELLLRRLPRAIRHLRHRYDGRPTLYVRDEGDLEDLLRVVLHLHFDDVRRETRTPSYSARTRTDFLIDSGRSAITTKLTGRAAQEIRRVAREVSEDIAYYEGHPTCDHLRVLIYDPEQSLCHPQQLEAELSRATGTLEVRCMVAC